LGALQEQFALAFVSRERGRALEFGAGLIKAAELFKEFTAHARQEVISLEGRFPGQRVNDLQARLWSESHRERDGPVQFHDGRGRELGQSIVQSGDALPVSLARRASLRVASGNRSL
jgi:hypothetical protein